MGGSGFSRIPLRPAIYAGDENSLVTRELRPKEASVELRAEAVKSTGSYRKQEALQVVLLTTMKVGEEPFWNDGMMYWLE